MTIDETILKLADILDDKANVASAEAILARRSGEDSDIHEKRAKAARFYAAACRTMVQECEGLRKRLAVRQRRGIFTPPDQSACRSYGREIGLPASECDGFLNHFTANGWKVSGKAPMMDWKAALRNWQRSWRQRNPGLAAKSEPKPEFTPVPDPAGWTEWLAGRSIAYQRYVTVNEGLRSLFRSETKLSK